MSDLAPHPETMLEDRQAIRRAQDACQTRRALDMMARLVERLAGPYDVPAQDVEDALQVHRDLKEVQKLFEQYPL